MKKIALILITIALLLLGLTSCDKGKANYSLTEIEVLKTAKLAQQSKDSITISVLHLNDTKLPIVRLYKHWYYPGVSEGAGIRYYKLEE